MSQSSLVTRLAVALSIVVHAAAVAVSLGYAGAGLYASAPEAVPVSLVTPADVAASPPETPTPLPEPQPDFNKLDLNKLDLRLTPLDSAPMQQAQPQPAAKPQGGKSSAKQQAAAAQASPPAPAQPAYTPPQPDISLRYQVDLGLKDMVAAMPPSAARRGGTSDFDDAATSKVDIDTTSITAFRERLRECAALPATISPDDAVVIVIRANFTPDASLANTPILIEASASAKGPALIQAAIAALQVCQPHISLPADKYAEWRVLDLRFTPRDFRRR